VRLDSVAGRGSGGDTCPACRVIDRADGWTALCTRLSTTLSVTSAESVKAIKRNEDRVADRVTAFAGSLNFVYLHPVWFAAWIGVDARVLGARLLFDEFLYGLLTMVISLEAIFWLRDGEPEPATGSFHIRSDLDFENNLRSEIWSVHIGQALGIDAEHVESVVRTAIAGYRNEASKNVWPWSSSPKHHPGFSAPRNCEFFVQVVLPLES
jgi:hypothetical protein